MRDYAARQERGSHRLRAVDGVSVQPGQTLSQGRQALPAGRAPGPPDDRVRRRSRSSGRIPGRRLRRGRGAGRRGHRSDPEGAWRRRLRLPLGRQSYDREVLPDGQVRPRVPEDAEHRLQRPAVHGFGAARRTRRRLGSIARPTRRATSSRPSSSGSAGPISPSALRSRPTTSGRRARAARRSSSWTPGSPRSRAPATSFFRCGPARTPRSLPPFCIS